MTARTALAGATFIAAMVLASVSLAQESPQATLLVGDAEAGAQFFGGECRGCHAVSIAPTLRGVIGRQIASLASFGGYSDGLKARSGEVWSPENLDKFLSNPMTFAPGTLMVKAIAEPQQRADVLAYLASLPPPRQ